tara:strand:+ start:714 stop:1265 length:552 start_codon:yes stop_codon:yes gene_type:complete
MIKTILAFLYISGILALGRLIPHPPNLTPILAAAIFAPYIINDRWTAIAIPLMAMFIADLVIGFHPYMLWVYGAIGLSTLISKWSMQFNKKYIQLGAMTIVSSVLFFVITNFAVWTMWDYYPKTLDGLIMCYTMAIPFFQNTLLGTIIYTALMASLTVALTRPFENTYVLVISKGRDYVNKHF